MKYEINLFPGKKGWELSLMNMGERFIQAITSNYFFLLFGGSLLLVGGYFFVVIPYFKVSPVHRTEIQNLKLMLNNYNQKRNDMFMQADILLGLRDQSISWSDKLLALGEKLPRGLWLSRISFEEEKERAGIAWRRTAKDVREIRKRFLVVEGATYSTERKSPITLVAAYIKILNQEPVLRKNFQNFELKAIKTAKEQSGILTFQLRAQRKELTSRKVESLRQRVRNMILQKEETRRYGPVDKRGR